jgi:hypothetical protein
MKVRKSDIYKIVRYNNDIGKESLFPNRIVVGVRARIELKIPYGYGNKDSFVSTHVTTPGVWGIQVADMNDSYLDEVFEEEKKTLIVMLESMGRIELEE